jgi:hypothetical protein
MNAGGHCSVPAAGLRSGGLHPEGCSNIRVKLPADGTTGLLLVLELLPAAGLSHMSLCFNVGTLVPAIE